MRHLRTVQCDVRRNMKIRMKTRHEKNWTRQTCVIFAGTDASSGHSVMKNALFPRSERSQFDDESTHVSKNSEHHVRLVAQLRRERMVTHNLADMPFLSSV